jgi:hypothetical protein
VHDMIWLRSNPPQEIQEYWQRVYPGIRTVSEHIDSIPAFGYAVLDHYPLPREVWWQDYYGPLQERIRDLRVKYAQDSAGERVLDRAQREVDLYEKYDDWYGSAYFVMQKRG